MTPDEVMVILGIFGILTGIFYQIYILSQRLEKATLMFQKQLTEVLTTIKLCPNCPHGHNQGEDDVE